MLIFCLIDLQHVLYSYIRPDYGYVAVTMAFYGYDRMHISPFVSCVVSSPKALILLFYSVTFNGIS